MNTPYLVRSSLALLLGKAISDLFPSVKLISIEATDLYFRCYFEQNGALHPEMGVIVEERLKGIIKENPPLEPVEMEKKGAVQYFLYHKQPLLAERVGEWEFNVVPLIRVGAFHMFYPGRVAKEVKGPIFLKVFEPQAVQEGYLLEGYFSEDKQEVKDFVRKRKEFLKTSEESDLFYENSILPKGVTLCEELYKQWKEAITTCSILPVITGASIKDVIYCHYPLANRLNSAVSEWGIEGMIDLAHAFQGMEKTVDFITKCLQLIDKTVKISGMNGEWLFYCEEPLYFQAKQWRQEVKCLAECLKRTSLHWSEVRDRDATYESHLKEYLGTTPLIVYQLKDKLGESVPGPFLRVISGDGEAQSLAASGCFAGNKMMVEFSLFGPLRSFLALQSS